MSMYLKVILAHITRIYICIVLGSLAISCSINTENIEGVMEDVSESPADTFGDIYFTTPTLLNTFIRYQNAVMNMLGAHSTDVVVISDPFYATNFIGASTTGYEQFYLLSRNTLQDSKLLVVLENPHDTADNEEVPQHNLDLDNEFVTFTNLSTMDWVYVKHAKRVIISPLLPVLAPRHYASVMAMRTTDGTHIQTIVFDEDINHKDFLSLDYSEAMYEMGQIAGETALKKNRTNAQVVLFLDTLQGEAISNRVEYFLRGVLSVSGDIETIQIWDSQVVSSPLYLIEAIEDYRDTSVVLIDLGPHTLTAVSQFMSQYSDEPSVWEQRICVVQYYPSEHNQYQLPVLASVEIPYEGIFEGTTHIKAILRRFTYVEN